MKSFLHLVVLEFLENPYQKPLSKKAKGSSSIIDLTEDEQMEMALRASLGQSKDTPDIEILDSLPAETRILFIN